MLIAALVALAWVCTSADDAFAGGFEVPENTTKSVARGGTGAVNKRDPSALYFNPALLPRARGAQVLFNVNFVNLNLEFDRDPLVVDEGTSREETRTFETVRNKDGFFPAPFLTASWDLGIDNLTIGAGIFGPSAYGERCYGERTDVGCEPDRDGAARYMLIRSSLIEFYASLGAGYRIELPAGALSLGVTGMATRLDTNFTLAVHGSLDEEKEEDPDNDAIFHGRSMSDWALTGLFGLAYELDGFRVAASYRPPISWEATGTAEMEPAESTGLGELTEDGLTLETEQAGSLRAGLGYEGGIHPGDPRLPRYDVEFNFVWEDWSRVENFRITPHGDIRLAGTAIQPLGTIYQTKGYEDTFSYRLGSSYAINEWLTGHAGGYYETGAQPDEVTSVDFVSWDRFSGGLGATFHLLDHWELDVAYMHVFSPERTVTDGQIYNPVPMDQCKGPDYDHESCDPQGTPPGNPQNNGTWRSSFQIASIGFTYRYE